MHLPQILERADKLETEELGVLSRELARTVVRSEGTVLLGTLFAVGIRSPTTFPASVPTTG